MKRNESEKSGYRPNQGIAVDLPDLRSPLLLVVIDTEEEFDWSKPLSQGNRGVTSIAGQERAQAIFRKHDIVPTYVVDYPVATTDLSLKVLKEFLDDGGCAIGAHLHPWVNPPFQEQVGARTSYPGNLPAPLEREKLARLTEAISDGFGVRPTMYKAGRYGLGPSTAQALEDLGYRIDASVVPFTSFADDGGPDFTHVGFQPYWFGSAGTLLELPLSVGFYGWLKSAGRVLYPRLSSPAGMRLRAPGVLSRCRALERIRLTPEGADHAAHRRLTESLLAEGCRVFSFTYHSPSLVPGHTPYVRDDRDLSRFLATMDRYFDYFIGELGGRPATPSEVYALAAGRSRMNKS